MPRNSFLASVAAALLASSAFPQTNVEGSWYGTVLLFPDAASSAKGVPMQGGAEKLRYHLTFKKGGAYTIVLRGSPDGKTHTTEGTWTRSGSTFTLKIARRDGKPSTEAPRQRIVHLAKDGKSMWTSLEGQMTLRDESGKEVKRPKGVKTPQVRIVFKRA